MERNKIYKGNCLDVLRTFSTDSIYCIVTSPPYFGPRNYGDDKDAPIWFSPTGRSCQHVWKSEIVKGVSGGKKSKKVQVKGKKNFQETKDVIIYRCVDCDSMKCELGHEQHYYEYLEHLMSIIKECKRVLHPMGTFWLNIGDSYSKGKDLETKTLLGIPQRIMIDMITDGWICRSDTIWYKPDPMPHPVRDRMTPNLEHIYEFGAYFPFYSVSKKYYFNQLLEPLLCTGVSGRKFGGNKSDGYGPETYSGNEYSDEGRIGKNRRTVWKITTANSKFKHFAVYPKELARRAIEAGCPREICKRCGKPRSRFFEKGEKISDEEYKGQAIKEYGGTGAQDPSETKRRILETMREKFERWTDCGCEAGFNRGIVLDPFMGSGTTALAALEMGVDYVGIEYFQNYMDIAEKRIQTAFPNCHSREAIREL